MAKETKTAKNKAPETQEAAKPSSGIDLASLTPEQLSALQKQLKEKSKEVRGKHKERFTIIDQMLTEKDEEGKFKHTTRDILNVLVQEKLVNDTGEKWDQVEIKKIQARKQFLEKSTGKDGELLHPEGTFGYKASTMMGFGATANSVAKFFEDATKVATLTGDQRNAILAALGS